jgi:endo-1,4-beta-xylanase
VCRNITYARTNKATAGTVPFQEYGWSKNPLVEDYIIEDYTSAIPFGGGGGAGGGTKGTVTSDGSDYTIYVTTRTNEPSIIATSTSHQYISVPKDKRQSGTITTQTHFDAWAKQGMKLGAMGYHIFSTEGYNNAGGSINQKITTEAVSTT